MEWRDLTTKADEILAGLPSDADKSWATTDGIREFWDALLGQYGAIEELRRTAARSTLVLTRRRETNRLRARTTSCSKYIAAALRQDIKADWPNAAPEQVLLLIAERFRALSYKAAAEEESS